MGVAHHLTTSTALPRANGSKICIFHLVYKSMHEFERYSVLLKWTGKTLKRIKSFLVLFLKYSRKTPVEEQNF